MACQPASSAGARYCAQLLARLETTYSRTSDPDRLQRLTRPNCWTPSGRLNNAGRSRLPRLRQFCGQVFRYAIATGRAKDDPSADLRGALIARQEARPQGDAARRDTEFLRALDAYDGDLRTRLALRLMVLTFVRTTELRAARWSEFENLDGEEPVWRVPAERTKMKRDTLFRSRRRPWQCFANSETARFRRQPVPVSFALARRMHEQQHYALRPVPMGYHGRATVHGFRAMASTALNEMGFRPDVIERQLAIKRRMPCVLPITEQNT